MIGKNNRFSRIWDTMILTIGMVVASMIITYMFYVATTSFGTFALFLVIWGILSIVAFCSYIVVDFFARYYEENTVNEVSTEKIIHNAGKAISIRHNNDVITVNMIKNHPYKEVKGI